MNKLKTIGSTVVGIFSSVLAFLGLVTCCGLPILAGILASIGIGASQLSFFAEYRIYFIALAIVSLLFGYYQLYFKKQKACCDSTGNDLSEKRNSCCTDQVEEKRNRPKSQRVQKIFLWIGTVIVAITLIGGNNMDNSTVELTPSDECCSDVQTTEAGEGTSCYSDSTINKV
ncbi:hypothetical protein [Dysgonomonas sp. ZJ709]|uniref:hypothetical protein n=1 Tax=Dysgonomonas sp. ZJ709 TaxID=2709797 RepID=UPI0013EC7804|nr:hypothetical protein [Dysgonomonas sp. ZJ709]